MIVRALARDDRGAWEPLWRAYCAFYETEIASGTTDITFERLCDATAMHATLCIDPATGAALGFAHIIVHPFTWSARSACYLEDLFVTPKARKRGVGRKLIEDLIDRAPAAGWGRIYWMTRANNAPARRLYDSFASVDDFVRYTIGIGDTPLD